MLETAPPCADVPGLFPEFAPLARVAYRLHCVPNNDADNSVSRIGPPILWPRSQEWPYCEEHGQPFTPVLQLRSRDVPGVDFFPHTDLMQLLWCACEHGVADIPAQPHSQLTGWVKLAIYWFKECDLGDLRPDLPVATCDDYLPTPAPIAVEQIIEYPGLQDLPPELKDQLKSYDGKKHGKAAHPDREYKRYYAERFYQLYEDQLSACPGTKIGGYVSWIQFAAVPTCDCGKVMDYLLTVSSSESDARSYPRWQPEGTTDCAHGLMLGDGSVHIFVCKQCESWPIRWVVECS